MPDFLTDLNFSLIFLLRLFEELLGAIQNLRRLQCCPNGFESQA